MDLTPNMVMIHFQTELCQITCIDAQTYKLGEDS